MRSRVIAGTGEGTMIRTPFGLVLIQADRSIGAIPEKRQLNPVRVRPGVNYRRAIGAGPYDPDSPDDVDFPSGGAQGGSGGTDANDIIDTITDWAGIAGQAVKLVNWLNNMLGGGYDPSQGGEIVRQLKSTSPPWGDVMIQRYVAWLMAMGHLEPRWSNFNGADVWANDGYNPSRFLDAFRQKYGNVDLATGATEYPFPEGRPIVSPDEAAGGNVGKDLPRGSRWDPSSGVWIGPDGSWKDPQTGQWHEPTEDPPLIDDNGSKQAGIGTFGALLFLGILVAASNGPNAIKPRRR